VRPPILLAAVVAGTVILSATVGSSAVDVMPQRTWRALVAASLGARKVVVDEDPTLADEARCRAAHASHAVLATFDRAPRLPGMAQDPDRVYAIARIAVRNCATGAVLPLRVITIESDPGTHQWERSVRAALGRALLTPSPAPRP
jgi:hypothetical protein